MSDKYKVGAKLRLRCSGGDIGFIRAIHPPSGSQFTIDWGRLAHSVQSRDWLDTECVLLESQEGVQEEKEEKEETKDPRTYVRVMREVDLILERCPFCGSFNQSVVHAGATVRCAPCGAEARTEDWNRRYVEVKL